MINFIIQNKEWLFSGIGITFIVIICRVIKKVFFKNKQETQKVEIDLSQSSKSSKLNENNLIPIQKISSLTFSQIGEMIEKTIPLQKDAVKMNFEGIKVVWDAYLKSITKMDGDTVNLRLTPGSKSEDLMSTIYCKVSLSDYRELGILPKGAKIKIQGEIAKADTYDVELINVKLFFRKEK